VGAFKHIGYGYIAQLSTFATLAVANIVLPNIIGIGKYAEYTGALAIVSLSCIIFNDAITLLVVRRIRSAGLALSDSGQLVLQAIVEHMLLGVLCLLFFFAFTPTDNRFVTQLESNWYFYFIAILLVALYIPIVAVFIATHKNDIVARLAALSGLLSIAYPLVFDIFGADIKISIPLVYATCLLASTALYYHHGGRFSRFTPSWRFRLAIFRRELGALVIPTLMRLAVIWLPVIALSVQDNAIESATYKVAISIIFGGLSLVPFSRPTMLSIDEGAHRDATNHMRAMSVVIATIGVFFATGLATPFTEHFMSSEYSLLKALLPLVAPYLLLQVLMDIVIVHLLATYQDRLLFYLGLASISSATAICTLASIPFHFMPIFIGSLFLALSITQSQLRELLFQDGQAACLAAAAAAFLFAKLAITPLAVGLAAAGFLLATACIPSVRTAYKLSAQLAFAKLVGGNNVNSSRRPY
jgi:hypothetical protein